MMIISSAKRWRGRSPGVTVADDRLRRDIIERVMCDLEVDIEAVAAEHRADPAPLKATASDGMLRFEEDGLASWDGRRIVERWIAVASISWVRPALESAAAVRRRAIARTRASAGRSGA